jgi:hypothetical protein
MAIAMSVEKKAGAINQAELDDLAKDFFELAETQLAKMKPEDRQSVIASVHATAENLRAER